MQCASTRPSYILTSVATRLATRRSGGWGVVREWMALKNRYEERSDVFFLPMEFNQSIKKTQIPHWKQLVMLGHLVYKFVRITSWWIWCVHVSPASHARVYNSDQVSNIVAQHYICQMFEALPKHRTIDSLIFDSWKSLKKQSSHKTMTLSMFKNTVEIMCFSKCPKAYESWKGSRFSNKTSNQIRSQISHDFQWCSPNLSPDPSTGTTSQTRSTHQIPSSPIGLLLTSRSVMVVLTRRASVRDVPDD